MAKIQAPDAWNITTGNSTIKIAILDTGIDQDHQDLAAKIVANQNFSTSSTVDDLYGHGTHVAGIAAAITNNNIGVAGVGYNSTLMNVKVLDDAGTGDDSSVANGITWAADNGAKVINMSLGGPDASTTLESAVNYAWNKGVVVVAAAGNNGGNVPAYPAYYTNAISVAASDQNDAKAPFSTYGLWVDVAAPGLDIYSTLPNHANYFQQHNGDPLNYGSLWGTSMSAPFVSGLAALVWSTSYGTSAAAVRSRIESTADPVTGTGTYWQKGTINAYKAVAPSGAFLITTDTATQVNTNSAILNGIINGLGTASLTDVSFIWGPTFGGPYPNTTLTQSLSALGPFSFALSGLAPGSTFYFKAKARSLSR